MKKLPDIGKVWIPDFIGPYDAVIPDDLWNGFLCPMFDWDTAKRMSKDTMTAANGLAPDEVVVVHTFLKQGMRTVQLLFFDPDYTATVKPVKGLYPIGGFEWVWERYPVTE